MDEGGEKEAGKQEVEESAGVGRAAGNIVLNRKIGILINTRGLSIKGRQETGT